MYAILHTSECHATHLFGGLGLRSRLRSRALEPLKFSNACLRRGDS